MNINKCLTFLAYESGKNQIEEQRLKRKMNNGSK